MDTVQTNSNPSDGADSSTTVNSSPIDGMISQVKSYIANPKMVTPETLKDLLIGLHDLKDYIDSEEAPEEEPQDNGGPLSGMVGNSQGGGYK